MIFNVILWVLERNGNDIERNFMGIGTERKGYLTSLYGYWNGRERIFIVILWVLERKGNDIERHFKGIGTEGKGKDI